MSREMLRDHQQFRLKIVKYLTVRDSILQLFSCMNQLLLQSNLKKNKIC